MLSDPTFFTRLPVQNGLAAARHFWWGTFLLLATVALVAVRLLLFFFDEIGFLGAAVCAAVATMTVPILAQMTMMFVACLWSQMFLGMRDYRVSASVCYYASPLVWPLAFIALLTIGMAFYFGAQPSRSWVWQDLFVIGFSISFAHALLLIMGLIAMLCVLFWWSRLSRALRNVRYANV